MHGSVMEQGAWTAGSDYIVKQAIRELGVSQATLKASQQLT